MNKLILEFDRTGKVQEPDSKLCSYLKNSTKFYLPTKNERNRVFFIHNETKILTAYFDLESLHFLINEKHLLKHFKNDKSSNTRAHIMKMINNLNIMQCKQVFSLVESQFLYYVNLFRYEMDIIIKI